MIHSSKTEYIII